MDTEPLNKRPILIGIMMTIMLSSLDQTILSTAMPQVLRDLNGVAHLSWVFSAYMLAATVAVPIVGRLSDSLGRRFVYLVAMVLFLVGSVLSGLSQSMGQLIFCRVLQGIGGGGMMVSAMAAVGDLFPPAVRGKYQGYIGASYAISSMIGPFLGGWITHAASWRWVFFINLPLGCFALWLVAKALPVRRRGGSLRQVDWWGALALVLTLVPLLIAIVSSGTRSAWHAGPTVWLLLGAFAAFVGFLFVERKAVSPIITFRLFFNRSYAVAILGNFLTAIAMFGAILFIPLFAQGVLRLSPTQAGMVVTPMMLGVVASSAVCGQIISRTGRYKRVIVVGLGIALMGLFSLSRIDESATQMGLMIQMAILGIGLGATFPTFQIVAQNAFDARRLGEVTGGIQLFRSLGGAVGTAIMGGVINSEMTYVVKQLTGHSFVTSMMEVFPGSPFDHLTVNILQSTLTAETQAHLIRMFNGVDPGMREGLLDTFPDFLYTIQTGFSTAMGHIFSTAMVSIFVAFVIVVVFLPETPLRGRPSEAGDENG